MTARPFAVLGIALLALTTAPRVRAQNADSEVRLQAAIHMETVVGDLDRAITLYRNIVSSRAGRPVVASALVGLGRSYEKLGRPEASQAYRRVVSEFADQAAQVRTARRRLAVLSSGSDEPGIVTRQLAGAPAADVGGLSPDGRSVAFVDWVAGRGGDSALHGHADLAIYDIATGRSRLVTHRPSQMELDTYIDRGIWSADGTHLAYNEWDSTWAFQSLHVVRRDGTGNRVLVANDQLGQVLPLSWSRDGGTLVCLLIGWDRARRIATVSVADGTVRIVKTFGQHNPWPLDLSPDGRFVVYDYFQAEGTQRHDVFVIAVDGSSESRIVSHSADDTRPFWTPDGGRIVFRSDRSGRQGLWSIPMSDGRATGEPELVRGDIGQWINEGFTRSGALFYSVPVQVNDVYTAEIDLTGSGRLGTPVPVTDRFVGTNMQAEWSPDGSRIAWLSHRGSGGVGDPHLVVRTLATGDEREIRLPFASSLRPSWSSDGRSLLIEVRDTTVPYVRDLTYRVDLATRSITREQYVRDMRGGGPGPARTGVSFATDRQRAALRSAGIRLASVRGIGEGDEPRRPGEEVLVAGDGISTLQSNDSLDALTIRNHMHTFELSPDGRQIAMAIATDSVADERSNTLFVMNLADRTVREILHVTVGQEITALRWTPDGRSILYAVTEGESGERPLGIWRVTAAGGSPQRLALDLTPLQLQSLRFHPDGRHVAFSELHRNTELWIMDGLPWQVASRGRR